MATASDDMNNFGVPRTPRRSPSSAKRSAFPHSPERHGSGPSSASRGNVLLRNPPRAPAQVETSYDSAAGGSLHSLPSLPVENTTTTRSGLFSLRHRSSASGLHSGRSTPAPLNIAAAPDRSTGLNLTSAPPSTAANSLRETFRKMFGNPLSSDTSRSGSRAASRQSNRVSCPKSH